MMTTTRTVKLNKAVELTHKEVGRSVRTVVPIPSEVKRDWGLSYGDYVRVSVGTADEQLKIGLAPLADVGYGPYRNNDFKLTSGKEFGIPRHLIRALGVSGDVWWDGYASQLVGSLSGYNNAHTLYQVIDYYTSRSQFPENDEERLTFDQLASFADVVYDGQYLLRMDQTAFRHELPEDVGIQTDEKRVFVVFYDGSNFIVGLLPYREADDHSFMRGALSASPESLYESLPSVLLNYEKDTIQVHQTKDETLYYTFPSQVGYCLSFDMGYTSEWVKIGDVYLARMIPDDPTAASQRLDPAFEHEVSE
jgi:hypothetical protein